MTRTKRTTTRKKNDIGLQRRWAFSSTPAATPTHVSALCTRSSRKYRTIGKDSKNDSARSRRKSKRITTRGTEGRQSKCGSNKVMMAERVRNVSPETSLYIFCTYVCVIVHKSMHPVLEGRTGSRSSEAVMAF
mmetsp:Transcript_24862/g.40070  ORF Transcript_24862/g.40070 Transcript_24862/m.40070 type:complete len:133 (-) Transcript_24862:92-490(-)